MVGCVRIFVRPGTCVPVRHEKDTLRGRGIVRSDQIGQRKLRAVMRCRLKALLHDRRTILRQSLLHPSETSGMSRGAWDTRSEGNLLGHKVVRTIRLKGCSYTGCLLLVLSRLLTLLTLTAGEQQETEE